MSRKVEIVDPVKHNIKRACDLESGEIGEMIGGAYPGRIVQKFSEHKTIIATLGGETMGSCWSNDCTLLVRVLPKGTVIQITV